eukprot:3468886-Amphidinium_carterae.1
MRGHHEETTTYHVESYHMVGHGVRAAPFLHKPLCPKILGEANVEKTFPTRPAVTLNISSSRCGLRSGSCLEDTALTLLVSCEAHAKNEQQEL